MSEAIDTLDDKGRVPGLEPGPKEKKESIGEFIQHTREELDKTTFPSSEDVRNTTIIVIVNVIFFAIYLFLVDRAWVYIIDFLTLLINKIVGA